MRTEKKVCANCGHAKPLAAFQRKSPAFRHLGDGYANLCKSCVICAQHSNRTQRKSPKAVTLPKFGFMEPKQ